jgi:creatinine amidohydrolase
MSRPRRFWQDMTTVEFGALDRERVIALLPVAAIEQHGPHLPVSVDATINHGVLEHALGLMPDTLPVTILPALPVGKSDEHGGFAGTLSLSAETLIRLWSEVGDSVARAGIRKLVLFNSHGGQPQMLDVVASGLRNRHRMLAVAVNVYRLYEAQAMFPTAELQHGIHAGAVETSIMLHLAPELVRLDQAAKAPSLSETMQADFRYLSPIGRAAPFAWQTQDLNPTGVCGDPTLADAEHGRRLVEQAAGKLVEILHEVDRFPLERLRPAPQP